MMLRLLVPTLFLTLLLTATAATPASAAYTTREWAGCAGGYNSGGFDSAGRTYVPCGSPTTIGVYSTAGQLVEQVELDFTATDVAPTADGAHIYTAGSSGPIRLSRGADGAWARDGWRASAYRSQGASYPAGGNFVATDASGNAYYADGAWAPNGTHAVTKFDPSGAAVTTFGSYANSWGTGTFYWMLTGLAVTPDGATVYTTEVGNNRVQTWRRGTGDTYGSVASFGGTSANNADRGGYCDYVGWRGAFAAPYDVALDAAGNIYVINTTCKQVLRFSPGFGGLTANIDVRVNGGDYPRPHGFAVGRDGAVFVGENSRALVTSSSATVAAPPVRRVAAATPPSAATPPAPVPAEPTAAAPVVAPPAPPLAPAPAPPIAAPPTAPTPSLRSSGQFTLRIARRPLGPRGAQRIRLAASCGRSCRVRIEVRSRGRLVGQAIRTLPSAALSSQDVRVGSRRVPGLTTVTIREIARTVPLAPVSRTRYVGA